MALRVDLHTHTAGDPLDTFIKYQPWQLIERAIELGYGALAITHHTQVFYDADLDRYARDDGLVLIPGMEANVNGKHTLVYCSKDKPIIDELNARSRESKGNLSFDQLARLKEEGVVKLIIAAHPYFILTNCLGNELLVHHDLFDLVEESWYHTGLNLLPTSLNIFNRNQKAKLVARQLGLPMIATSDAHFFDNFGTAHSIIHSEHDLESIIKVLQSKDPSKIRTVSPPITLVEYISSIPKILKPFL